MKSRSFTEQARQAERPLIWHSRTPTWTALICPCYERSFGIRRDSERGAETASWSAHQV